MKEFKNIYEEESNKNENRASKDSSLSDTVMDKIQTEEKKNTLIAEVSFSLTAEEAYICLKQAGIFKTSGKRAVLYTALMAIAAIGFVISYIVASNYNWLVFAVISLLAIAVIWVVPYVQLKRLAKANAKGNIIKAAIFDNMIEITGNESTWDIPLNGNSRLSFFEQMIIFHTESGQLFAIPERAIAKEKLKSVRDIIKKGTRPYEE